MVQYHDGYWKDEASTAKALDEKGYHTGDLAIRMRMDTLFRGSERQTCSKSAAIGSTRRRFEDALMETELLIETVVLGLPDALLGHKLVALVTPKSNGCTASQILMLCFPATAQIQSAQ